MKFTKMHGLGNDYRMQIRTAVPADLQEIVNIEAECFPAAEAATKVSIAERLAVYSNHFWVQLDGDRMTPTFEMRCMRTLPCTTKTVLGR